MSEKKPATKLGKAADKNYFWVVFKCQYYFIRIKKQKKNLFLIGDTNI